jgi:hypothetical protein
MVIFHAEGIPPPLPVELPYVEAEDSAGPPDGRGGGGSVVGSSMLLTTSNVLSIYIQSPAPRVPGRPFQDTPSKFGVYLQCEHVQSPSYSTAESKFLCPSSRCRCLRGSAFAIGAEANREASGSTRTAAESVTNAALQTPEAPKSALRSARPGRPNPPPAALICAARSCAPGDIPIALKFAMSSILMLNGFILGFIPFSCASCTMRPLGMAYLGEPSPRLNPPAAIPRPAGAACRYAAGIALLPSSLPPKRPEMFESARLVHGTSYFRRCRYACCHCRLSKEALGSRPMPGTC